MQRITNEERYELFKAEILKEKIHLEKVIRYAQAQYCLVQQTEIGWDELFAYLEDEMEAAFLQMDYICTRV